MFPGTITFSNGYHNWKEQISSAHVSPVANIFCLTLARPKILIEVDAFLRQPRPILDHRDWTWHYTSCLSSIEAYFELAGDEDQNPWKWFPSMTEHSLVIKDPHEGELEGKCIVSQLNSHDRSFQFSLKSMGVFELKREEMAC